MIRSIVVSIQYLGKDGEKIKKYQNHKELRKYFLEYGISYEEYKMVNISNFITKDSYFTENKHYSIKISTLSTNLMMKIIRILFLMNISKKEIIINRNQMNIKNILFHHFYSREFLFQRQSCIPNRIKFKFITPVFFKIGDRVIASMQPKYVYQDLLKTIKKSDFEKQYSYFSLFSLDKIICESKEQKERNTECGNKAMIGEAIYKLENDATPKDKWIFYFLSRLAFFSSVGWKKQEGYGQIEVNFE